MLNCVYSVAIGLLLTVLTEGIDGCSVNAIDKAASVGDYISVTCSAGDGFKIRQWKFEGLLIFMAAYFDSVDGKFANASIRDGYSVDNLTNTLLQESTLTIKNVNHSNAGRYSCQCATTNSVDISASAISNIVIVSTPTFSTTTALSDGQPITFSCNVSFNGTANSSIAIEDSTGNDFTNQSYTANSIDLHNFVLPYVVTADSSSDQAYWCNIILRNDSSSTNFYSKTLEASVQWTPVQNAKITGNSYCVNGGKCTVREAVICSAEGNPQPTIFNWTMSVNGSESIQANVLGDQLTLTNIGLHEIRCTAFNMIKATSYNSTSDTFTTQVTVDGPKSDQVQQDMVKRNNLIIGLVVGLGGGIIIIIIIVLCIFFKRKKSRTGCCNVEDEERKRTNAAMELKNGSAVNGNGSNVHTTSGGKNLNDEVTLVENDLYSGKQSNAQTNAQQIDPSDGGYASVNEVMHGK